MNELTPVIDTTAVVTYEPPTEVIAKLKEQFAPLVSKADTPEGYKEVSKAIATTREYRGDIERRRVALKADALAWGRKVDSEAKRLTGLLLEVEEPLKAKKKAIDDAEEAAILAKLKAEDDARKAAEQAIRDKEEAERKAIRDAEEARIQAERDKLAKEQAQLEQQRQAAAQEQEAIRQETLRVAREQQAKIDAENARKAEELEELKRSFWAERTESAKREEAERKAMAEKARQMEIEQAELKAERDRQERAEFERQAKEKAEKEARERAERELQEARARDIRIKEEAQIEAARIEAARPDVEKIHAFGTRLQNVWATHPDLKNPEASAFIMAAAEQVLEIAQRCNDFTLTKKGKTNGH